MRVRGGWDIPLLQRVVDQFVIHYDVAGTSRNCFEVLQDKRGLSVHFMLDLDGTIYQSLDLKEGPGMPRSPTAARSASRSPTSVPTRSMIARDSTDGIRPGPDGKIRMVDPGTRKSPGFSTGEVELRPNP